MILLISPLCFISFSTGFCVETFNLSLRRFFVLEIKVPDVKSNNRKKGDMFDLHETSVLTRLKNQNLI